MKNDPPPMMIEAARRAAILSPCAKSKRGAVIYTDAGLDGTDISFHAAAFNGPPPGLECHRNDACASDCGKRCMHAEARALRDAGRTHVRLHDSRIPVVMLHVKVIDDVVVPGGGPSCFYCSRDMLDAGFVHGIWLYQMRGAELAYYESGAIGMDEASANARWRYWEVFEFHRESLAAKGVLA